MKELRKVVIRQNPRDIPSSFSSTMRKLIAAMLHKKRDRRPGINDVLALPHIRQTLTDNLEAQRAVPVRRHRQRSSSRQPTAGPAPAPAPAPRRQAWDAPAPAPSPAPVPTPVPAPAPAPALTRQTDYDRRPRPFEYWSPPENGGAPRPRKSVVDRQKRADGEYK